MSKSKGTVTAVESNMSDRHWPERLTEVPYWVFQDEDVYRAEQLNIFHGRMWNYLCLEAELAEPGDFCATFIGEQPVLVTRDHDGEIYAFENRCAHRGSLIAMEHFGHPRFHRARARRTQAGRSRSLHTDASKQLEALHGEHQGLLSREYPAPVFHHVRPQQVEPEGWHHRLA